MPDPPLSPLLPGEADPALSATQRQLQAELAQIWSQILRRPTIGIHDDFFASGGHSLLAIQMFTLIEERLGVWPSLQALFECPTIEHLAGSMLRSRQAEAAEQTFWPVQPDGCKTPFHFWHGDFEGGGFFVRTLARELGKDRPLYAIHPHGLQGDEPPRSIAAMAAERVATIRTLQPQGPYLLGGYCSGALVAFEAARCLEQAGESVPLVILLMAGAPTYRYRYWHRLADALQALLRRDPEHRGERSPEWGRRLEACVTAQSHYSQVVRRFWQRSLPEKTSTLRRNAGKAWKSLSRSAGFPVAGAEPPKHKLWLHYRDASDRFLPRLFGGKLVLLWPEEERHLVGRDPTYGWSSVCPEVELIRVPGNHDTCITSRENLAQVGQAMQQALDDIG